MSQCIAHTWHAEAHGNELLQSYTVTAFWEMLSGKAMQLSTQTHAQQCTGLGGMGEVTSGNEPAPLAQPWVQHAPSH